jgi:uncharacterized protein
VIRNRSARGAQPRYQHPAECGGSGSPDDVRGPSRRRLAAVLSIVAIGAVAAAAQLRIPPSPSQWVTDTAAFLSPSTAGALNAELRSFDERTGHQVLVYIGRTTGGYPIEEYAVKAFEAWKPGRKGLDDGLVLFVMAEDRRIRIEVGYGLEDRVPDATAGVVINDIMAPRIQAGDNDGALREAVKALTEAISGKELPAAERPGGTGGSPRIPAPLLIIVGVVLLIIFIKTPAFALWLLFSILGGGRGGGFGGGGGGGFRGGGGRSGGGGASGGW